MPTSSDPYKDDHRGTYFILDRKSEKELTRLTIGDQMITAGMGGVLSEQPDPTIFRRVLDVGCRTGGWIIEAAKTYPTMSLVGIDISKRMIEYARIQARQVSDQVDFRVMDALLILEFPAAFFDLVNLRFKEDMALAKKLTHNAAILFSSPLSDERQVECARDYVSLQHYLMQLINERRGAPREDLMSDLLETSPGETPFNDAELVRMVWGTLAAGYETSTQLIGNGVALLLEQPERWQTLCAHPKRIPQAIEEILRYDPPVVAFFRTTTREVTVGGIKFPPETLLMVVFDSANRDETQFPHADQFDMQRSPNRHLAFGHGVHFCLGAFLARKEGQIAFETLCQRLPNLRLVSQQTLSHTPILRQRGLLRLEVVW